MNHLHEQVASATENFFLRDEGRFIEHLLKSSVLKVDMTELSTFCSDQMMLDFMTANAQRFVTIINDVLNVMLERLCSLSSTSPALKAASFQILLVNPLTPTCPLRQLSAHDLGSLVKVRGIVTRASEIKPVIEIASYYCFACGAQPQHDVRGVGNYLPLRNCPDCFSQLQHQTREAKFVKHQEVRLQEISEDVPVGHTPCSIIVKCYGELTRLCAPGDIITLTSIYLVQTSAKNSLENYLHAMDVCKEKSAYVEMPQSVSMDSSIDEMADSPDVFSRLSCSVAPEIFGHDDVKKALLLQLVSGVTRVIGETPIRGDIHICLIGDPGLAKSQFLKYISRASPRGVYTTGKGSSGVGLTASVVRDPSSAQMMLATGALVLADGGVCAIDEFDKMDDEDRTAIHEVMEQQTVSISKAGLTTMLNARSSVLAAANPVSGRFKHSKSFEENVRFPTSLLSRFDLTFLLLDTPSVQSDLALAKHVTYVHRYLRSQDTKDVKTFTIDFLRYYISQARRFEPFIPPDLSKAIVGHYVEGRQQEIAVNTTPRQLLSIIRLAQALARLRFDDTVNRADFDEAARLCSVSKTSTFHDHHSGRNELRVHSELTSKAYKVRMPLMMHFSVNLDFR